VTQATKTYEKLTNGDVMEAILNVTDGPTVTLTFQEAQVLSAAMKDNPFFGLIVGTICQAVPATKPIYKSLAEKLNANDDWLFENVLHVTRPPREETVVDVE
jgi:hypothetical protein